MHEQFQPSESEKQPAGYYFPRLHNDFQNIVINANEYHNDLADSRYDVHEKFSQYIRYELSLSEGEADTYLQFLIQDGMLPDDKVFREDPFAAVEKYRLAVFQAVRPSYLVTHDTNEYQKWLHNALIVVVPKESRHEADICLRRNGDTEESCEYGVCPIKVMIYQTTQSLLRPNFESIDYLLDPHKTARATHVLLSAMTRRRYIPEAEEHQLRRCYDKLFAEQNFPDASQ